MKIGNLRVFSLMGAAQRRRLLSGLLALFLLLSAATLPCDSAAEPAELKTVRVAVEDSGIFFKTNDNGETISGYGYEYIQNIAAYADWRVEYRFLGSFSDCLQALQDGEADLFYDVSYTEERAQWLLYPDMPMGTEDFYLFCLSGNMELRSDDYGTFNGKRVGVTADTIERQDLELWCAEKGITMEIVDYDSDPEKEAALVAGEIDMEYEISLLVGSGFSALAQVSGSDYYLVAPLGREDLIRDINAAYLKIEDVNRYFLHHLNEKYFSASVQNRTLSADERQWIHTHHTLRVGYIDDYLPFCGTAEDGKADGIVKDLLPQMLESIGLEDRLSVEYRGYTSSGDLYAALMDGTVDLVFPVIDNIEYGISRHLLITSDVITLSADLAYAGAYSADAVASIAVNRNNQIQEYYTRSLFPEAEILSYDTTEDCLHAVADGKVGSTVLNGLRTSTLLSDSKYKKLNASRLAQSFSFSFAVGEGNAALLSVINRAIVCMDSGAAFSYAFNYVGTGDADALTGFFNTHKLLFLMILVILLTVLLCGMAIVFVMMYRAKKKLTEANNAKTSFLFNMSHDIRTPMNAILGFTDMAQKNLDDRERVRGYLDKTRQAGNLLLSLINSVLEMSRIEAGKAELEERPGKVDCCFDSIKTTLQELAGRKNIDLSFNFGEIQDHYVYVDYDRTIRIFMNIISNAIKYTNPGGWIVVYCRQVERQGDNGIYRFTFQDNGIGMSADFQEKVFDEFSRENNSTSSGVQGSGLGLSVAKTFVELMNGTIQCESRQGVGTTFTVTLPLRIQKEAMQYVEPLTGQTVDDATASGAGAEPVSLAGKRILLVEDNEMNREIAVYILNEENILVEEADDGSTAVELLKEKGADYYDAILMDIQMPIMNGYEATKAIREMYPEAKLPIIALSANAFAEDRQRSMEAGMDGHIAKPIDTGELLQTLTKLM